MRQSLFTAILTGFLCLFQISVVCASVPGSFSGIIEKADPAVVNISTTQVIQMRDFPEDGPFDFFEFFERDGKGPGLFPERKRKAKSLGSGFLISSSGYIVTNYHVVDGAEEIEVTLNDNKAYKAKVVGKDKRTDLALLKIEVKQVLPYLELGDSDKSKVGDFVVTIGSPYGLSSTATSGIISAKARHLGNQYDDYIQTDAAINRGNSGGPMLNMEGEVIGINTVILSPSGGSIGIGFAIPSSSAKPVIEQLKAKGEVVRGWLGVSIQPVNEEMAKVMGRDVAGGALIAAVLPNSPAASAGVQVADIVTKVDGVVITDSHKLSQIIAATPVGKQVELEIFRNNSLIPVKVTVGKLQEENDNRDKDGDRWQSEEDAKDKSSLTTLGMRLRNLDDMVRKRYGVPSGITGVVVTNIKADGAAANARIRIGDVIVQVNKDKITSTEDFKEKMKALKKQNETTAALLVANSLGAHFVVINLQ